MHLNRANGRSEYSFLLPSYCCVVVLHISIISHSPSLLKPLSYANVTHNYTFQSPSSFLRPSSCANTTLYYLSDLLRLLSCVNIICSSLNPPTPLACDFWLGLFLPLGLCTGGKALTHKSGFKKRYGVPTVFLTSEARKKIVSAWWIALPRNTHFLMTYLMTR